MWLANMEWVLLAVHTHMHTHTHTHTHTAFKMQNCSMGVNQDCIAAHTDETWMCISPQVHSQ